MSLTETATSASTALAITLAEAEISYPCAVGDTLLRAALRAGLGFPYECNTGSCGTCKYELVQGEVLDRRPDAAGLSERDRRKGRRLACQSQVVGDAVIRCRLSDEYAPVHPPRRTAAQLVGCRDLTHDLREFTFRTQSPARFRPGQYAVLELASVSEGRCYSMSNLGNEEGMWAFQIKRVPGGAATTVLFDDFRVGDTVSLDGPFGTAYLRDECPRDVVCVAGGSGLSPMVSIARGLAALHDAHKRALHFFYGGRSPADICGQDLVEPLAVRLRGLTFHPVISDQPTLETSTWDGPVGFVHDLVRQELGENAADFEFYAAGPPPMTEALARYLLVEAKVPVDRLHYDRFY